MRTFPAALLPIPLLLALLVPIPGWGEQDDGSDVQDAMEHPDDPWEGMNRGIFAFNESLDQWFLEPVAEGWDTVVPEPVQDGIGDFFHNLGAPTRAVHELLQAKPALALETLCRFQANVMLGLGGIFDVASRFDVYDSDEDFGQTLGYWGTPSGPYLVIPFFGSSNPRDAVGLVADSFAQPHTYFVPFYASFGAATVQGVNARAGALETIAAERAAAFDFYSFVRSAAIQFRENQVRDRAEGAGAESDEDLYYFDEDEQ